MRRYLLFAAALVQIAATAVVVGAQEPKSAEEYYRRAMTASNTLPPSISHLDKWRTQISSDLDRAVALDPKNSKYLTARAKDLESQNSPRAKAELDRLIRLKPNSELYSIRADWFDDRDQRQLALIDRTNAIRLKPGQAMLYSERAFEYLMLGQYEKALLDYTRAVALEPNNIDLYLHRGENYEFMGRNADAEADYTRAIELYPIIGYEKRANFYWVNDDHRKAIADITKVIELDPKKNAALILRFTIYKDAKEYDKAIGDMSVLIERMPEADYYELRAELYRLVGKNDLALKDDATAAELKKKE